MADAVIRIYFRRDTGQVEDGNLNYELSNFGGFLPSVGDVIFDGAVPQGLDRCDPLNHRFWKVLKRVFNPKGLENYVALVVEERTPEDDETDFVS